MPLALARTVGGIQPRRLGPCLGGRHQHIRCQQHHQLGALLRRALKLEEVADDRDVAKQRNFGVRLRVAAQDQAAEHDGRPVVYRDGRVQFTFGDFRHEVAVNQHFARHVVGRLGDFHDDHPLGINPGRHGQVDADVAVFITRANGSTVGGAGGGDHRALGARDDLGFGVVGGDDHRGGKDLGVARVLRQTNDRVDVQVKQRHIPVHAAGSDGALTVDRAGVTGNAGAKTGSATPCRHRFAHRDATTRPEQLFVVGDHGFLNPVDARPNFVTETDFNNDRFNHHLGEHDVEVVNQFLENAEVVEFAHQHQRVGAFVGEDLGLGGKTSDARSLVAGGVSRVSGRCALLGAGANEIAQGLAAGVGRTAVGVGRSRVRGIARGFFRRGRADKFVQDAGQLVGLGIFKRDHAHGDRGIDRPVKHIDDLVEEGKVFRARNDKQNVGPVVGDDPHPTGDHTALSHLQCGIHFAARLISRGLGGGLTGANHAGRNRDGRHGLAHVDLRAFFFRLRVGDQLVEFAGDQRGLGITDLINARLHLGLDRLIEKIQHFGDAGQVGLGVGHHQTVGALERLDFPIAVQEPLNDGLNFGEFDVLQGEDLRDQFFRFGEWFVGQTNVNGHAFLASLGGLHRLEKLVAHRHQRDVVHREHCLDRLHAFGNIQPGLALEGDRGVDARRLDDRLAAEVGDQVEHLIERGIPKIQLEQLFAASAAWNRQLLTLRGRRGRDRHGHAGLREDRRHHHQPRGKHRHRFLGTRHPCGLKRAFFLVHGSFPFRFHTIPVPIVHGVAGGGFSSSAGFSGSARL